MTDQELQEDIQKQASAGFSPEEIRNNLSAKGIASERIDPLVNSLAVSLETLEKEKKKSGNSWIMLVMAALGFVRAAMQSGQGRTVMMTISLLLAIGWVVLFIYEQSKK